MIVELNDIITANNNVLYLMSHDAVIMILSQLIITIELTINQTVPPSYKSLGVNYLIYGNSLDMSPVPWEHLDMVTVQHWTHRKFSYEILLNQTEIRWNLPFSDWFWTKRRPFGFGGILGRPKNGIPIRKFQSQLLLVHMWNYWVWNLSKIAL